MLSSEPLVEVGVGNYSGNWALATPQFQVELQAGTLVILDKQDRFRIINDEARQRTILHELLQRIPESIHQRMLGELQAQGGHTGRMAMPLF